MGDGGGWWGGMRGSPRPRSGVVRHMGSVPPGGGEGTALTRPHTRGPRHPPPAGGQGPAQALAVAPARADRGPGAREPAHRGCRQRSPVLPAAGAAWPAPPAGTQPLPVIWCSLASCGCSTGGLCPLPRGWLGPPCRGGGGGGVLRRRSPAGHRRGPRLHGCSPVPPPPASWGRGGPGHWAPCCSSPWHPHGQHPAGTEPGGSRSTEGGPTPCSATAPPPRGLGSGPLTWAEKSTPQQSLCRYFWGRQQSRRGSTG